MSLTRGNNWDEYGLWVFPVVGRGEKFSAFLMCELVRVIITTSGNDNAQLYCEPSCEAHFDGKRCLWWGTVPPTVLLQYLTKRFA